MLIITSLSISGCKSTVSTETTSASETTAAETTAAETTTATTSATKEFEVAWLAPMEHVFWYYVRQGMEEEAAKALKEKGFKININQMAPVEAYNITEQTTQFENMISKKVDAILICPVNEEALVPTVKAAHDAGIAVVSVSAVIPSEDILAITQPYEDQTAKNIAEYVIKNNGNKGNVIDLYGMAGNITSQDRQKGFEEGIAEFPDVKILDTQPVEFNKEKGMTVMENMLTKYPNIDFVFCCNDDAALGAYEAAAAVGRQDKIIIAGDNGTIDGLQSILESKLDYTVFTDPFKIGRDSIAALVESWSGNQVKQDQYRYVAEVVDKNNAQSFLDIYPTMEKWYKTK